MSYTGPRNPNPRDGESRIIIYNYVPSLALQIVAIITFAIALLAHAYFYVRKPRSRLFEGLLASGCIWELVGYAFRLLSHYRPFLVSGFVVQYFFIVCAPILFAAAFYLSLSLIARYGKIEDYLPLRARLIVIIFVVADVVTIGVQVAGAALVGVTESKRSRGEPTSLSSKGANDILLAGLTAQCFSFLIFLIILSLSIARVRHNTTANVRLGLTILLVTSLLLFTRTLFRLAETAQGVFGYASSNEYLFGIFEFTPVALCLLIWAAWPLHRFLGESGDRRDMLEK